MMAGMRSFGQGEADTYHAHARDGPTDAQALAMREAECLAQQLESHRGHDACRDGEHPPVQRPGRRGSRVPGAASAPDPQRRDPRPGRLTEATQHAGPQDRLPPGVERQIERERHGEAVGDVVDEQRQEDCQPQRRIGIVGGVGDHAFGKLMQGDRQ
jgi:hypothetical protein